MLKPNTLPTTTNPIAVIGDVHNNYKALKSALKGPLKKSQKVILLGDYIHKGDADGCAKVVDLLSGLVSEGKAIAIRGNHDDRVKKGVYGTPEHEGDLTDEQADWLRKLPLFVRYDGWLFLHGGINQRVSEVIDLMISNGSLPETGDWTPEMVNSAVASLSSKNRKRLLQIMHIRYVRGDKEKPVTYGQEIVSDRFWAENYTGAFGFVLFGHNPWKGVALFNYALGIDLGAGSQVEDLDTPLREVKDQFKSYPQRRLCRVELDQKRVTRISTFYVDSEIAGFQQGNMTVSIPQRPSAEYLDLPHEVQENLREYHRLPGGYRQAYRAAALLQQGVTVGSPPLGEMSLNYVKSDIEQSVLNVEHAAGSLESPAASIKLKLLLDAEVTLLAGYAYGLQDLCDEVLVQNWMPLVNYIKNSEGYEGLPGLVQEELVTLPRDGKLKDFWFNLVY